jgi:hypothetical protein
MLQELTLATCERVRTIYTQDKNAKEGTMRSSDIDPAALGFTVVAFNVALEEALKALAEKHGNRSGPWLDEVQELALLRARGRLTEAQDPDAAAAAIAAVESVFARMRSGFAA